MGFSMPGMSVCQVSEATAMGITVCFRSRSGCGLSIMTGLPWG